MNTAREDENLGSAHHLNDFELEELLIGEASTAAHAHLAACAACSAQLATLREPLSGFTAVSLAWAERRCAATEHLTDDALDLLLIEDSPAPAAAAHLAGCAACRERLDAVAGPVAGFRALSLAWSERRSATLPMRLGELARPGFALRFGWAGAMAAGIAVAVAVAGRHHEAGPNTAQATPPAQAASAAPGARSAPLAPAPEAAANNAAPRPAPEASRRQQIEADNQMLAAIDHELTTSQQTLAQFGLDVSSGRSPQHGRRTAEQD